MAVFPALLDTAPILMTRGALPTSAEYSHVTEYVRFFITYCI